MSENNKAALKKILSTVRLVATPLIGSFVGWIAGGFLAILILLIGRSDPIDPSIGYVVSSTRKAIAKYALIIPYFMAVVGFIVGIYIIYKQIKRKSCLISKLV